MKVRFWTSVARFALGLAAWKGKKAAEARYIGAEWFGNRVKFHDYELITPYLIAIPPVIAIDIAVQIDGSKFKNANNIWLLGKNNLDKFGDLSVASDTDRFPTTQVVVSKTEAIQIACSDFLIGLNDGE
jgi:hypothetical protein